MPDPKTVAAKKAALRKKQKAALRKKQKALSAKRQRGYMTVTKTRINYKKKK